MLYPLTFEPIFMERVWGGRRIADMFGKPLPPDVPIGESWEISDRPEAVSKVTNGPLAGSDLHQLIESEPKALMGSARPQKGRFPLLVKILDAQSKLSLQVHPPPQVAERLQGEPKTEMWYIAAAEPGARLYVGLKHGVSRADFERKLNEGKVADCFHSIPVQAGEAMFLPSGRVHAIGEGIVIFEIQQNSDTTYRVFDWNRVGLDGKPRQLHIEESLASIDFDDFEPDLVRAESKREGQTSVKSLVDDPLFHVALRRFEAGATWRVESESPVVLGGVEGEAVVRYDEHEISLGAGRFCLVPAACQGSDIHAPRGAQLLIAAPGAGG